MSENKIKIEIDGRKISADRGQMLIEVTDKNEGGLKWAKRTSTNIAINVETRPPQVCSSTSPRA